LAAAQVTTSPSYKAFADRVNGKAPNAQLLEDRVAAGVEERAEASTFECVAPTDLPVVLICRIPVKPSN
jgi:hypothetical protein